MKGHFYSLAAFFFLILYSISLSAQNIPVSGRVTDDNNGEPVAAATVKVKGAKKGIATNTNGEYTLDVAPNAILVVSSVGYATREIPVDGKNVINITLKPDNNSLNEVVIVGYKTVKKRDVSGAVSSIDMKDLKDIPAASLLTLLAGKAPGVQAVTRTGLPGGSGGGLVIRGNTSLSDASDVTGLSNPLYIVDGVPVSLTDLAGFDVTQNDFFATLNPNDIESIDILK